MFKSTTEPKLTFQITSPLSLTDLLELVPGDLKYLGSRTLTQFYVLSQTIYSGDNESYVQVNMTFQRIYLYHLIR